MKKEKNRNNMVRKCYDMEKGKIKTSGLRLFFYKQKTAYEI